MKISGSTPLFAVLGNPIKHSLSPLLHNGWLAEFGYDGVYVALEVDPEHFELTLDGLFHAGLQGANVTSPFKERTAAQVKSSSERASKISSVNCLTRNALGFHGDSTDGDGFIADLDCRAPGWRDQDGHIVVLGAGGAARALLYALFMAGKRGVHIVNRTVERAASTASIIDGRSTVVQPWDNMAASLLGAGMVINVTSAQLTGGDAIAPDFSQTHPDCLVYDSVYAPNATPIMSAATRDGRRSLGGLGMLVGQGALAFESWFGTRPDLQSGIARLEAAMKS
jgi:shikimate dehydrogenase